MALAELSARVSREVMGRRGIERKLPGGVGVDDLDLGVQSVGERHSRGQRGV